MRGISRAYVMEELATQLGMQAVEKNIEAYDVYTADEAFMTGTPFCLLPVTRINGLPIGNGDVGPVFGALLDRWSENTGVDIDEQIKTWNSAGEDSRADDPTPYRFRK